MLIQESPMKCLIDVHCHVMTLARPSIGSLVDNATHHSLDSLYSQVAAPGFMLLSLLRGRGTAMRNLLSVVENDPAGMLMLMEDDLAGQFGSHADPPAQPLFPGTQAELFGELWDSWLLCPQLVDFSAAGHVQPEVYYARQSRKLLSEAIRELFAAISGYRRERPKGRLVVRPFLGLDPGRMTMCEVEDLLYRYLGTYSRKEKAQLAAFRAMKKWKGDPHKPPHNAFAGIKLYPPLGFDPWPDPAEARDKVRLLYSFAERYHIPITVHCDDEGYRTIPLSLSHRRTAPERWFEILEEFPDLIVNFAHFGHRYLAVGDARDAWSRTIVELMVRWPGVYADVSFVGAEPAYWEHLSRLLDGLPEALLHSVRSRLMFGTDFYLCLGKCRSYLDYLRGFADSCLDRQLKLAMMHENPHRFLFGSW
jgi:hypothetical protein